MMEKKKFPKVKETVASYIMSEEGKITKQSLITMGAFMGGAALAAFLEAEDVSAQEPVCKEYFLGGDRCGGNYQCGPGHHCNALDVHFENDQVRGHHANHSSY